MLEAPVDDFDMLAARPFQKYFPAPPTIVVVSPHFDDGVFSCGELLAGHPGSVLLTVFAAAPAQHDMQTAWDTRCGFASAEEAVAIRSGEDARAAAEIGATTRWQHFIDSQYAAAPAPVEVAAAIDCDIAAMPCDALAAIPMGLFHEDHRVVAEAGVTLLTSQVWRCCVAYEEAPYRLKPGLMQQRLAQLHAMGVRATPLPASTAPALQDIKRRAVRCYASQLRAFGEGGYRDVFQPERYWLLERITEVTT